MRHSLSFPEAALMSMVVFFVAVLLSTLAAEAEEAGRLRSPPSCATPPPLQLWCVREDPETGSCLAYWLGYAPPPPEGGAP